MKTNFIGIRTYYFIRKKRTTSPSGILDGSYLFKYQKLDKLKMILSQMGGRFLNNPK